MTDAPPEVDLPRFSRQIGVTGLGRVGDGDAEPRPIGVLRPFRGVLAAGVCQRQRRAGGTSPQLAYLTLASLVDHGLQNRRAEAGQHDGFGRSAATGTVLSRPEDESKERESVERDSDDTAEEPTVRELLRTTDRPPSVGASETSERAGLDGVARDASTVPTLSRAVRQLNEPEAPDELSGPVDASGWTGGTEIDGLDSGRPGRTVVDRSDLSPDGVETTRSDTDGREPAGSHEPTIRERLRDAAPEPSATATGGPDGVSGSETGRQAGTDPVPSTPSGSDRSSRFVTASADATTANRVGDADPVGTVVDRPVFPHGRGTAGSDENEAVGPRTSETVDNTAASFPGQPRMTVVDQQDPAGEGEQQPHLRNVSTGEESPAWEQPTSSSAASAQHPGLTVRQPHATGERSEAEAGDQRDEGPSRGTEPQSGSEPVSTPPTVIAPDGSVNDRILDRLYEELRRKERIERDREGR